MRSRHVYVVTYTNGATGDETFVVYGTMTRAVRAVLDEFPGSTPIPSHRDIAEFRAYRAANDYRITIERERVL